LRQKKTKADETTTGIDDAVRLESLLDHLTPTQETACHALLSGKSITDAAEAAGVQRQTVSGWLNHDPNFIASYNRRRLAIASEFETRLRSLGTKALETIEAQLDGPQGLDAAKTILRALASLPRPEGPITPADVEIEQKRAEHGRLMRELAGI
jgi:hypothetical protein